mmetsp:Transcript_18418/g.38571  ORF Transcript_18418/g.38571 Transcript_18418/m.38571 type:complete len:84 (+) Transcript_18418:1188-1439(+)
MKMCSVFQSVVSIAAMSQFCRVLRRMLLLFFDTLPKNIAAQKNANKRVQTQLKELQPVERPKLVIKEQKRERSMTERRNQSVK